MEIEFKFCIPPERLAAVRAAVRRGSARVTKMQARYFDTRDGALSSRGIAFRLRKEGTEWVQTVKAPGQGPLDRQEHNVAMGAADESGAAPFPQPELHAGTVAGDRLLDALNAAQGALSETYGTEMERWTRDVAFQGSVVELALDTGQVVAHRGTPQQRSSPVCELELELKSGPVSGLTAVAARWAARHGLFLSTRSKAARGERLTAATEAAPATKAQPLRTDGKHLPHGRDLQRAIASNCLAQILGNATEIVDGMADAEHVHQLRIGIRRLRTALRELGPLSPCSVDPQWAPALADTFQRLGGLRDRQQVVQAVYAQVRDAGAPALSLDQEEAAPLSPAEIVRTPALQAALIGIMGFTAAKAESAEDALSAAATRRFLNQRLRKLHRSVQHDGHRFTALAPDAQHRLRKRLKRLRYLTEFLAPALDSASGPFVDSLQPALSALGRLSDERAAAAWFSGITAASPQAWFYVGWIAARQAASAAACEQALAGIADKPPRLRKHGVR